ncbi:hypothetical protein Scep_001841 [Stephania cephalantha]|uniref:Uncharacterized protein n=1 Tax=Stephania cephalantha TaxID=152367 RepID=A0AAP0LBJ9_9MAGN
MPVFLCCFDLALHRISSSYALIEFPLQSYVYINMDLGVKKWYNSMAFYLGEQKGKFGCSCFVD